MFFIETGIDMVEIERLETLNPRIKDRFCKRVFTEKEILSCNGRNDHLAGRFAVKEAASKALGTGIGLIRWHEIEILPDEKGKPRLYLHGEAARFAQENGWISWSVSITHTATMAAAVVTALLETLTEK
jgi:holo-[acyl-carrier protein] synthase